MTLVFEGEKNLLSSDAEVLVIPVNTVGAMGRGLALYAKKRWPSIYASYKDMCQSGMLRVGVPVLHADHCSQAVLLFPTKAHWADPSNINFIQEGLQYLLDWEDDFGITSYAFPALGCGNGQLDYPLQVRPIMLDYLDALKSYCEICL